MTAEPLKTLLLPFETGDLAWPEGTILFLNGDGMPGLPGRAVAQQYFKPRAAGCVAEIPDGPVDLVLIAGSKQRGETQYMIGRALELLKPSGTIVCAAPNDAGGKRLKADLEECGLSPVGLSKHKSQVVWAQCCGKKAPAWVAAGRMQRVLSGAFVSQPGIFGWDKIDTGSALLAAHMPDEIFTGAGADFGCGYGYLADHILRRNHAVRMLYCLDADYRAVTACRENLAEYADRTAFVWTDLTAPQHDLPPLEWVVMNPPFHEGKKAQYSIGTDFIKTAASSLKPGGTLWMVANAQLPYETVLDVCFAKVVNVVEDEGFKVFHVRK